MKEQVIVNRGETFDNLYLIEKGEVYVKDHSKGDVIATIPRYGYFGDYQIFNNSNSNVCFSSSPTERVVCYTISSSLFIKLCSESSNHTHFFKQRSLATRRIFKRLVINRHSLIEKVLNDQVLKLKRDRNHKYNQDQIIITQNFIQNKLKILQQRRTSQSTKKIDLLCDDYFEYFESQSLKDFSIDHLEQSYIESELDYFSENEIENEDQVNEGEMLMFSLDSLKSKITRISDILNYQMQSSESKQKGNSTRKRARQKHSEYNLRIIHCNLPRLFENNDKMFLRNSYKPSFANTKTASFKKEQRNEAFMNKNSDSSYSSCSRDQGSEIKNE